MSLFDKAESKAREATGTAEQAYGEATGSAEHQIKGTVRKCAAQGCDTLNSAVDTVKSNPLAAATVAAGIGFIFGYLAGKK
ncbi:DUF883 C-terminal domain-containing protein [Providencia vermicola]|uniref:CsbD family protein n=2 Tax=Providencia TaxID=586 RepID=A0AAI9I4D7_PROST|nr:MULTISPECIES: DUF883 C-terminal domain-containing protein [Providencia]ELR5045024.1 CsbD family protein [Providencia rettgeri]ELR5037627.1 CsbD family protein [Providencia stuartii]ELR5120679.1 CsbD family protein [Providencia stuartii]ELR5143211.1 CsbD family protein [Providencia stuartii]ELR5293611.1 CsbD family protein [Providencia stuartii]